MRYDESKDTVMPKVTFIEPSGKKHELTVENGQSLLDIAHANHIDLEGACEGSLACSTCHVIVDDAFYDRLPEATDAEEDMLDLAWGLTHTSRLGCQIIMNDSLDGLVVTLPAATRNMQVGK